MDSLKILSFVGLLQIEKKSSKCDQQPSLEEIQELDKKLSAVDLGGDHSISSSSAESISSVLDGGTEQILSKIVNFLNAELFRVSEFSLWEHRLAAMLRKLPFDLIVHEILTRIVVNPTGRYSCYGRFESDPNRELFFCFSAISFNASKGYAAFPYVDRNNLVYLCMWSGKGFKFGTVPFPRLQTLNLHSCEFDWKFLSSGSFPALRNLILNSCSHIELSNLSNFGELRKLDVSETTLVVKCCRKQASLNESFKNLRFCQIFRGRLCPHFNVMCSSIRESHLLLSNCSSMELSKGFCRNVQTLILRLGDKSLFGDDVFEKMNFRSLHTLHFEDFSKYGVRAITGMKWKKMQNLKVLHIEKLPNFSTDVFKNVRRFPQLEELSIKGKLLKDMRTWKLPSLKKVRFDTCAGVTDDEFKDNPVFANLSALHLEKCYKVRGLDWSNLKKMKELNICWMDKFTDEVLSSEGSPCFELGNIENLQFKFCKGIRGKWGCLENVRVLKVESCNNFDCSTLSKYTFPHLQTLQITGSNFSGKDWKFPTGSLEVLSLWNCVHCSDLFFQRPKERNLSNLKELTIYAINLHGSNWQRMDSLTKVYIKYCKQLGHNLHRMNHGELPFDARWLRSDVEYFEIKEEEEMDISDEDEYEQFRDPVWGQSCSSSDESDYEDSD